uniref:Uncharacterized protein n=1 Tax=Ditylenchus dipsaci TaxID=166011 RepID=A0A915CRW5_9BILA
MAAVKTTLNCMQNSVKTELKHICSLGISESNSSGSKVKMMKKFVYLRSLSVSRPPQMCKLEAELQRTKLLIEMKDADALRELEFKFGWKVEEMTSDEKFEMLSEIVGVLNRNGLNKDSKLAKDRLCDSETTIACVKAILSSIKACVKTEEEHAIVPIASCSSSVQPTYQIN